MSLLSYNQIASLLDDGIVENADMKHLNSASLDIQLGPKLLVERTDPRKFELNTLKRIVLKDRDKLHMTEWNLDHDGPYILFPGEFILAHSIEVFNLPNNISAEYKLKSSMARIGLDHLNAGWCDAGWHGSALTLELKNCSRFHEIVLNYKDLIGQMIFFLHEEVLGDKSYAARGRYNNDRSVSGSKLGSRGIKFGDSIQESIQEEYDLHHPVVEFIQATPRKILEIGNPDEIETNQDPIHFDKVDISLMNVNTGSTLIGGKK
jgi:dCTP deaminase